ncbi:putative Mg(2+) transport ATPase [Legionella beliardensis]|uniref:Protein MgtC n=1 Tax=Legionella beliardensis TaxID=91822 RepID=A0A378I007_9GAMM|nr:MgtC/SapB family protein [Legionella beliardensis]STX28312.1 putative Mg(2+) transport ATPase [Legionella beliardensis]
MLSSSELLLRLLLAAFLGCIIGLERERLSWAMGLRTHMLVCTGSCLIMIISAFGFFDILSPQHKHIILDPSRIAAQVVSGIGFLGAGAIILRNNIVYGLTTAASIWIVAGIGLAIGGGLYFAGIATTIIILVILIVVKPLEDKFEAKRTRRVLHFQVTHGLMSMELLKQIIGENANEVQQLIVQPSKLTDHDNVTLVFSKIHNKIALEIIEQLENSPYIKDINISNTTSNEK